MNKARRKEIDKVISDIEALKAKLAELDIETMFLDIQEAVNQIRDDEREVYDNMPEGLQSGDRGSVVEEAVNNLDSANESLEEIIGNIQNFESGLDSAIERLNDAQA